MEDFSSNNEYHFIKNLTPRLFAVDPSYKTNKAKLMRNVRLLCSALDGKIPPNIERVFRNFLTLQTFLKEKLLLRVNIHSKTHL